MPEPQSEPLNQDVETQITQALELLGQSEVKQANSILSRLVNARTGTSVEMRGRLKPVLDVIQRAIQDTPEIQPLFEQAEVEAATGLLPNQLNAFRLYSYLGGQEVEPDDAWPPFRLTLRTVDARREAARLGQELRAGLEPLLAAFRHRDLEPPPARQAFAWLALARGLAGVELLETEEEWATARWIEGLAGLPPESNILNHDGDFMSEKFPNVLDQLNQELERLEKLHHPDAEYLWNDIERYSQWLDKGQQDPPPDLSRWNVRLQARPVRSEPEPIRPETGASSIAFAPSDGALSPGNEDFPLVTEDHPTEDAAGSPEVPGQSLETESEAALAMDAPGGAVEEASALNGGDASEINGSASEEDEIVEESDLAVDYLSETERQVVEHEYDQGEIHFNQRLEEARQHLENGQPKDLRTAIAILEYLGQEAGMSATLQEIIREKLDQARTEQVRRLEEAIRTGDEAKAAGDIAAARRAYQRAQEIGGNGQANKALLALDQQLGEQLSQEKLRELREGLKALDDIRTLEPAVYEAERLMGENRLPEDFVVAARKARERFDKLRKLHGEVTTQARYGNLSQSKAAVDQIQQMFADGQITIKDPIAGTRPTSEALEEANVYWENRSSEAVTYTLTQIDKYLTARPRIARSIYDRALVEEIEDPDDTKKRILVPRPFHEDSRRTLEVKLDVINAEIDKLNQAEKLLAESRTKADPIVVFKLILQAKAVFPHLDGIDSRLEQARGTALKTLLVRVDSAQDKAQAALGQFRFEDARSAVKEAGELIAAWPDEKPAQVLEGEIKDSDQLLAKIKEQEENYWEFKQRAAKVREYRKEGRRIPLAFRLLKSLVEDERFKDYPDLRQLNLEMDDYRGVEEQLETARSAEQTRDWERVYQLTKDKAKSVSDGKIRQEFLELFAWAEQERQISIGQKLLKEARVKEANAILSRLVHGSDQAAAELRGRIQPELDDIRQAIQDSSEMQELARLADQKAAQDLYSDQLLALRLYRHVGGVGGKPDKDWPAYRLSLATAEARVKAASLAGKLKAALLDPILEAYRKRASAPLTPLRARSLAAQAAGLREAELLVAEEERDAARWLELEQGEVEADELEAAGDWEKAVKLWTVLDLHYPRTAGVQARLRQAWVREAVMKAEDHLKANRPQDALQTLWDAQSEPTLSQAAEIALCLAEVHAARDEFEDAFGAIARLEKDPKTAPEAAKKRRELEREQAVRSTLDRAEAKWKARTPEPSELDARRVKQALEILQEVNPLTAGSKRINEQIDTYFNESKRLLREKADAALQTLTPAGKLEAMKALLDLRSLEEVLGIPEEASSALHQMKGITADLKTISRTLLQEMGRLELKGKRTAVALAETQTVADRLDVFAEVLERYPAGFETEIKSTRSALVMLGERLGKLNRLQELSATIYDDKAWEKALSENAFSELAGLKEQIDGLDLSGLIEPEYLGKKLDEWQAIHAHLMREMKTIRELFIVREDFEQVIKILAHLKSRPLALPDGIEFAVVQQPEYEAIYAFMGDRFKVVPLYGDKSLVGWEAVRVAAESRQAEYHRWAQWAEKLKMSVDRVEIAYLEAKVHLPEAAPAATTATTRKEAPLGTQKRDWQWLKEKVEAAIKIAQNPPRIIVKLPAQAAANDNAPIKAVEADPIQDTNDGAESLLEKGEGQPALAVDKDEDVPSGDDKKLLPIMSEKAETCQKSGTVHLGKLKPQLAFACEKIEEVERKIQRLGGFPTAEELKHLVELENWDLLRTRLEQAEKIGPYNPEEEKRIHGYTISLKAAEADETDSSLPSRLIKKIFNR